MPTPAGFSARFEFQAPVCENKKAKRRNVCDSWADKNGGPMVALGCFEHSREHRRRPGTRHLVELGILCLLLVPESLLAHTVGSTESGPGWTFRADVVLVLGLAAVFYVRGWCRLRRYRSRAASTATILSYFSGIVCLILALLSPIDPLANERLSMHMTQHLLLLMLAPLLLLLANPFGAWLWGLPQRLRRPIARLFRPGSCFRSVLFGLTWMPVAWCIYVVNLWLWHHPSLYQAALVYGWLHDLEHVLFFLTALLFWSPVVNAPPLLHGQISLGFRIVYLLAATLQNTLLGMSIALPSRLLYPRYENLSPFPMDDQALGGGIMWVSGHMYLIPIIVLIAWKLFAEDDVARMGRQAFDRGQN